MTRASFESARSAGENWTIVNVRQTKTPNEGRHSSKDLTSRDSCDVQTGGHTQDLGKSGFLHTRTNTLESYEEKTKPWWKSIISKN